MDEEPDGRPSPGMCAHCNRARRATYEVEALGIRLCRGHIRQAIRRALWKKFPNKGDMPPVREDE